MREKSCTASRLSKIKGATKRSSRLRFELILQVAIYYITTFNLSLLFSKNALLLAFYNTFYEFLNSNFHQFGQPMGFWGFGVLGFSVVP